MMDITLVFISVTAYDGRREPLTLYVRERPHRRNLAVHADGYNARAVIAVHVGNMTFVSNCRRCGEPGKGEPDTGPVPRRR